MTLTENLWPSAALVTVAAVIVCMPLSPIYSSCGVLWFYSISSLHGASQAALRPLARAGMCTRGHVGWE